MKIILASASPRRLALLQQIDFEVEVKPAAFAELSSTERSAREVVGGNALGKGQAVVAELGDAVPVLSADTIVVLDDKILEKPQDEAEAVRMLRTLSGRTHEVLTGVSLSYQGKTINDIVSTTVYFRVVTEAEIAAYVATGEPLDKAGAYGIQGRAAVFVEKIDGDYNNVVGLPLTRCYEMLQEIGALKI